MKQEEEGEEEEEEEEKSQQPSSAEQQAGDKNKQLSLLRPVSCSAHHPLSNGCDDNWTWSTKDKSHEVRLYGPKQRIGIIDSDIHKIASIKSLTCALIVLLITAHFHPNWSNGTAGVRGTRCLNQGRYYWEINVSQRIFGTRYCNYIIFTFVITSVITLITV